MKKALVIFSIYFSGYISCYFMTKKVITNWPYTKVWTTGDRGFALGISIFSWIGVAAAGVCYITDNLKGNDTPAKW